MMDKKPQGDCDQVVSCDDKVAMVKWYDNRPVIMASNFTGVVKLSGVDEVQWWNKKRVQFVMVLHPEAVQLHNEAVGGIDLLDQLVSLYRTDIRSKKVDP